jgi:hypothetical protein
MRIVRSVEVEAAIVADDVDGLVRYRRRTDGRRRYELQCADLRVKGHQDHRANERMPRGDGSRGLLPYFSLI